MTDAQLKTIEEIIGYEFQNPALLRQAFTRSSYVNEMGQSKTPSDTDSNEVLEFIGDSVLSTALVSILIRRYASIGMRGLESRFTEGDLSIIKSNLSDKHALSEIVAGLGIADLMRISRGDRTSEIYKTASPQEDLFESIIGAVALDCGMDLGVIIPIVEHLDDPERLILRSAPDKDPKSTIKEHCEKLHLAYSFALVGESGPDHLKEYTVECTVDGRVLGRGVGRSKKLAERAAAANALELFNKRRARHPKSASDE